MCFPTQYRTNTHASVRKWAGRTGFEIVSFEYLGQYPAYFMFKGFLFLLTTAYEKLICSTELLRILRAGSWSASGRRGPEVDA